MTENKKKNMFTKKIQDLIHKKNYLENNNTNYKKKTLRNSNISKSKNNLVPLNLPMNLNNDFINKKPILANSDSFTSSIEIENSMIKTINDGSNNYNYQSTDKYGYSTLNKKKIKTNDIEREREKGLYEVSNFSSFEHVIINEIEPLNEITLQSNLYEDYNNLNTNIEKLQLFLKNLKCNYVQTYESYTSMVDGYNNLIRNINVLYKRVESQTEKINKINDKLCRLSSSNIWLKNQHNTFLLYKKEINKYIEVFKKNLHDKTEEIRNLYEENNKITQENIKYECQNDLLKRDYENSLLKNQKFMNDKQIIIEDLACVRLRINNLEKKTRDKYYEMINEMSSIYDTKIIGYEKCLGEIKDIIFIHRNRINKLKSEIYLAQERTIELLKMNENKRAEISECEDKIKIMEEERAYEKQRNELEILNFKNEIKFINEIRINEWKEFVKHCRINGYDIITLKLKKLIKAVNAVVIRAKEFSKRDTGECFIEYYTNLIKSQKQIFEHKEEEYINKIKSLEAKKKSTSEESNVWDCFN